MACIQNINLPQKRIKTTGSHKIVKSIQKMVEKLKKTIKENISLIFLNKINKFFVSKYKLYKILLLKV